MLFTILLRKSRIGTRVLALITLHSSKLKDLMVELQNWKFRCLEEAFWAIWNSIDEKIIC